MKRIIFALLVIILTCTLALGACDVGTADEVAYRDADEVLVAAEEVSLHDFAELVTACNVDVKVRPTLTGYAPNGANEERVAGLGAGMWVHVQVYNCWRDIMVDKLGAVPP